MRLNSQKTQVAALVMFFCLLFAAYVLAGTRTGVFGGFEDSSGAGSTGFNESFWSLENGTDADETQIDITTVRTGTYSALLDEGDEGEVAISTQPGLFDMTGNTYCNVSFWLYFSNNLEPTDDLFIDVYDGTWYYGVKEIDDTDHSGGVWTEESIEVSSYIMDENFRVRFDWEANQDSESVSLDDINITCIANNDSVITNITVSNTTIKGGDMITFYANYTDHGVNDSDGDTLYIYCDETTTPSETNTNCTGGTTSDQTDPYSLTCSFIVPQDDVEHVEYCRLYDGFTYSTVVNTSYTTDSTPPTTTINNVAGDSTASYFDAVNDGLTNITVDGEANMACRWSSSDLAYTSMSNACTVTGTQALCSANDIASQGLTTRYVACADSLGNGHNRTQNLNVQFYLDYTAPTTSDDSTPQIHVPTYIVNITELDNVDGDPTSYYCTSNSEGCDPTTAINDGEPITYTSGDRGLNYLRYYSIDDAGNTQDTVNKTITINTLPIFTSAVDDATTIIGGAAVNITTDSNDTNGQEITLYVCKGAGANSSGCLAAEYCNVTSNENASCSFDSETEDNLYTWYAYLFDSVGEAASNNPLTGTYTTYSIEPSIAIVNPDNTTYNSENVSAAITLDEDADWAGYCLDDCSSNTTMTSITASYWVATLEELADGEHNITFYANDSVGNMGVSAMRLFAVDSGAADSTPPGITIYAPTNDSYYTNTNVTLNITLDEAADWAGYSLNGGDLQGLTSVTVTNWNSSVEFNETNYYITFYVNDSSGNMGNTSDNVIYFTVDATDPQFSAAGYDPSTVNDNESVVCSSTWTDNLELSVGIVEENSTGVYVNHTIPVAGTSNEVNYTITALNLTPSGVTCWFHVNDTSGNSNSTSVNFTVNDATAPIMINLSYVPTTAGELDANISVNITVNATDNYDLSSVTLQFKAENASVFTNSTMSSSSTDIYQGNFTPDSEGLWIFQILAEDGSGNKLLTALTNVTISWENTFMVNNTIPAVKSIIISADRIIYLENLTINNTGDYTLNFTVYPNVSWVFFNGTVNNNLSFAVDSGSDYAFSNVTVNATGFPIGLYDYSINVSAFKSGVEIGSEVIAKQVNIQNTAGPYLVVTIDTYSTTVTEGASGIELSATVTNLGTTDATGVYLNWTLPTEFTLASGSLTMSIGTLSIGGSATNTITIDVGSDVDDTSVTITSNAISAEDSTDSASKSVTIGSATETVTSDTGGSGTVTIGTGHVSSGDVSKIEVIESLLSDEEILSASESFELVRGKSNSFPVEIKNIFEGTTLEDVSVRIEGYLSKYVKLSEDTIKRIRYGKTKTIDVEIISPEYMEKGTHELTIIITGKIIGEEIEKDLTETRKVTLEIHTISKEDTIEGIIDATEDITRLAESGFSTAKTSRLLQKAQKALERHDYEGAWKLTQEISEIKETTLKADSEIDKIEGRVSSFSSITGSFLGVRRDFPETQSLLNLARAALERGDPDTAMQRLKEAELAFAIESGEFNMLFFLLDYWWVILISGITLIATGLFTYVAYSKATVSQKITNLQKGEETVRKLMKETQKKHYKEKEIGPASFHRNMSQYQNRMAKIRQSRTRLRHKRVRLLEPEKAVDDLKEERQDVFTNLQKLQKGYFVTRTVGKAEYEDGLKFYNQRLAEIEDEQTTLEIELSKAKKRKVMITVPKQLKKIRQAKPALPKKLEKLRLHKIKPPKITLPKISQAKISLPKIRPPIISLRKKIAGLAIAVGIVHIGMTLSKKVTKLKKEKDRFRKSMIKNRGPATAIFSKAVENLKMKEKKPAEKVIPLPEEKVEEEIREEEIVEEPEKSEKEKITLQKKLETLKLPEISLPKISLPEIKPPKITLPKIRPPRINLQKKIAGLPKPIILITAAMEKTQEKRKRRLEEKSIAKGRRIMAEARKKHLREESIAKEKHEIKEEAQKRYFREKAWLPKPEEVKPEEVKPEKVKPEEVKPEGAVGSREYEKQKVLDAREKLQRGYFITRRVSKDEYEQGLKHFNERLAEIEDKRIRLDSKGGKKE